MKGDCKTYIITFFFISLFVCKGIHHVLPGLFTDAGNKSFTEQLFAAEKNEENKSSEEKIEKELREFFVDNNSGLNFNHYRLRVAQTRSQAKENLYKQADYLAIPTPPPEQL